MRRTPAWLPGIIGIVMVVGIRPIRPAAAELMTADDLVAALRAAGAAVEPGGGVSLPAIAVPGRTLVVDGERVTVFAYPDQAAAEMAAGTIAPDGRAMGQMPLPWAAPAHVFRRGALLVFAIGAGAPLLDRLTDVLGPQIAGA